MGDATAEHHYEIVPDDEAETVLAKCACGWSREYAGVGAERTAVKFAEMHSNTRTDSETSMPIAKPQHETSLFGWGNEIEASCICGWSERFGPGPSERTARTNAAEAAAVHKNTNTPWTVSMMLGLAVIAVPLCVLVFVVASAIFGGGQHDSGVDDGSHTDTGRPDESDCREMKAYWADRENGKEVVEGMGDCSDW